MTQAVQQRSLGKIGDYKLTGKIGQGGVAEIYKARQESLDREVAIKVLFSKLSYNPDIVRRFERESLVIAKLNHPNIVHVIDKGYYEGRYYFVMSYIDGMSLREVIDSQKVGIRTKLEMIIQVCKALDYAHKNGVIHRDIKPTNVLIDRQGNALVADFGIAQIVGTPENEMTSTDLVMGTMAYMSPEQKVSSTNIDQTTDIYAVGVMLYEILVGKKPLGHFKMPSEINPEIDIRLDQIVHKCLAQEPKDRFQRAVELKDAILNIINGDKAPQESQQVQISGSDSFMSKCRFLDTIKETEFGSTILVENRFNKKLYVIKKHHKGDAGRKEAKLLSNLRHRNIIDIFGSGGNKKNTVVITEYAQGGSLNDRMARKFGWEKAFRIILQVASGLDHAHKNNIIHGNIRPSNILFDANEVPKIADFGLPPHYDNADQKDWYQPPEKKKSKQGDIYSLGVILHRMISGANPAYDNEGHLNLEIIKNEVPPEIGVQISNLLAIKESERYQTCDQFLSDWEDFDIHCKEMRSQSVKKEKQVETPKNKVPHWAYLAAFGIWVVTVFATLLISGFFK